MFDKTWICKDGRVIKIKDMEDSHLINTINMLRRKGLHEACFVDTFMDLGPPPQGEYAFMAWEQEIADLPVRARKAHPSYKHLVDEWVSRGCNEDSFTM